MLLVFVCLRIAKIITLKNGQTDSQNASLFLADEVSGPSLVRACKCSPLSWSCEAVLFLVPPACLLKVGISMIWLPGLRDRAGDREKML